jgi:hypothetical protein
MYDFDALARARQEAATARAIRHRLRRQRRAQHPAYGAILVVAPPRRLWLPELERCA